MDKLDVFGGTGFIGSRFCELYSNITNVIPRDYSFPLTNSILYFISTTNNYNVLSDAHIDVNTNLNVLLTTLENCKNNKRVFNFISSWFVYGECELPAGEDAACNPKGFYSITKRTAEQLLMSYCETFNIKYRIFRLCNVYGKNDKTRSSKKNALQYLIDKMLLHEDIDLYHGGDFIRDYMHVDDVCHAIKLCIDKALVNKIINVGSGIPYRFSDLINLVAKKIKYTGKINEVDASTFHKQVQVKDFYMSTDKLQELGFQPNISIEQGLESLLDE